MARLYWKVKGEDGKWGWRRQLAPYPINPAIVEQCYCSVCAKGIIDEQVMEEEE